MPLKLIRLIKHQKKNNTPCWRKMNTGALVSDGQGQMLHNFLSDPIWHVKEIIKELCKKTYVQGCSWLYYLKIKKQKKN